MNSNMNPNPGNNPMNGGISNPQNTTPNYGTNQQIGIPQTGQVVNQSYAPTQNQGSNPTVASVQPINNIPQPPINPQAQMNTPPQGMGPNLSSENQGAGKEPENNNKSNRGSIISSILMIVCLLAFVVGLPYITDYLNKEVEEDVDTKIENDDVYGVLKCTSTKNSDVATTVSQSLYHTNDRLTKAVIETKTVLLSTTDEAKGMLANIQSDCEKLKTTFDQYPYIEGVCEFKENQQVSTYTMDYLNNQDQEIDYDVTSPGGFTVEYALNQDIKTLRNKLTTNGYSCSNQTLNRK